MFLQVDAVVLDEERGEIEADELQQLVHIFPRKGEFRPVKKYEKNIGEIFHDHKKIDPVRKLQAWQEDSSSTSFRYSGLVQSLCRSIHWEATIIPNLGAMLGPFGNEYIFLGHLPAPCFSPNSKRRR